MLVHGAFADASSWNAVTERLLDRGLTVVAPANPLRGIEIDSAYIASVLRQTPGPVARRRTLVRRCGDHQRRPQADNVVGLVYVAAFAPDEGERLGEVEAGSKDSVLNDALVPASVPDRRRRHGDRVHRSTRPRHGTCLPATCPSSRRH